MALLQGNQGQTGKSVGQSLTAGFGEYTELLITELQPRYYENTYRGLKFGNLYASAVLATAAVTAINPLINPTGSNRNLVLLDAYVGFTGLTAVATGTLACLGWFAAAVTPTTIGTLQTPVTNFIGSAPRSVAICAPTATILVAPAWVRTLGSMYGDLSANDVLGIHDDIAGAVIVPPGFGVALIGIAGTPADVTVQVGMTWDEIPV